MNYVEAKASELMSLVGRKLTRACRLEVVSLKEKHTLATAKLYVSKIRAEIRASNPEHPALKYLVLPSEDYKLLNARKEQGNYKDITNLRPIVPNEVIARARGLSLSNHPGELAVGLMLLCGRRGVELICKGEFSLCVPQDIAAWENAVSYKLKQPEQHVWFVGQAKIRGDPLRAAVGYPIPLLCPVEEFMADWRRLKEITPAWQYGNYHDKTAILLGEAAQRGYGGVISGCRPKDLRAAYAEICYALYSPEKRGAKILSYEAYFAHVLGHREGRLVEGCLVRDVRTAQSYRDFTLVSEEDMPETTAEGASTSV